MLLTGTGQQTMEKYRLKHRLINLFLIIQTLWQALSISAALAWSQGDYSRSRQLIDPTYHTEIYSEARQAFQDQIIHSYLEQGISSEYPLLIFTAGPMGAGKSTVIRYLHGQNVIDLKRFVWIDPDEIKKKLPEFEHYLKEDPITAASKVHKESVYLQEVIFNEALQQNKNIILDRAFRGVEWHRQLIEGIRSHFPQYSIEVYQVEATREIIYKRLKEREEKTGRYIPKEIVDDSIINSPKTIAELQYLFDKIYLYDNNTEIPVLIKVTDYDTLQ